MEWIHFGILLLIISCRAHSSELFFYAELVLGSIPFDLGVSVGLLIHVPLRRTTFIPASSSKREKWTNNPRSSS